MAAKMSDYEKKLMEMQYHMKENQLYMQDYFEDLDKWTNEMKTKEKEVIEKSSTTKEQDLPPIRSLATTKKKKKVKKSPTGDGEKKKEDSTKKKLSSYDYRAWDKIDVDKLCEEVDNKKSSSSEYTTDEEWEEEQCKIKANWEKERGNQFFKDNMLNEAINCYTKAIQLDPDNAIYPANRAMCLIKQERFAAAEVDCTLSISLDSKYTKAYHRRATARAKLGKLEEACKDFEYLLKLDPTNKAAQIELNKLESQIENRQLVFPIVKTDKQRSTKPLKRIEIQEINDDSAIELENNLKQVNQKVQLNPQQEELFKIDEIENKTRNISVDASKPVKEEKQRIKIIEVEEDKSVLKETSTILDNKVPSEQKPSTASRETVKEKHEEKVRKIPDAPSNAYQFKKDWQSLSQNLDDLAAYFKKIPASEYSKLFLSGLESEMLSKILNIYCTYFINESDLDLYSHLKQLSQVKRFQTQLMFISDSDKKNIDVIIEHLKRKHSSHEIEQLKKMYTF